MSNLAKPVAVAMLLLWTTGCVSDGRPPHPELDPASDHTKDSPQPLPRSLAGDVPAEARPLEPGPEPARFEGPTAHDQHGSAQAVSGAMYSCPMHPEVRQATPGECPKCGMRLVQEEAGPVDAGAPVPQKKAEPSPKPRAAPAAKVYTCSMHPEVRQPAPGRCPKCGMKLEPAEEGHEGHR